MKRIIILFLLLTVIAISGCTASDSGNSGGYERPSSHQGHHH